jgi:hypothetical protein
MANTTRPTVGHELKEPLSILEADPHGWWALHTALVSASRRVAAGDSDYLSIATASLKHAASSGFGPGRPETSATRYTGKPIMAWQDALYVVNELPEWRFPDAVLLVAWLIECGGPEMGRGPARASFHENTPEHYVGETRDLFNAGKHGNGPGWPASRSWSSNDCRYTKRSAA